MNYKETITCPIKLGDYENMKNDNEERRFKTHGDIWYNLTEKSKEAIEERIKGVEGFIPKEHGFVIIQHIINSSMYSAVVRIGNEHMMVNISDLIETLD